MSDRIRIIGEYIEINYERVAQILPGKCERTLREEIFSCGEEAAAEAYEEGRESGLEDGREKTEEAIHALHDKIDAVMDRLLKEGVITEELHDIICERLPAP